MKVLLTHGYFLQDDPREQAIMRPYPPLGLLCLSAYLKPHGFEVEVYDSTFGSFQELKAKILAEKPDVVGIYVNLMTRSRVVELTRFIRGEESLRGTRVVLGGPEVRHHAEEFLRRGAHAIVMGEGEETLLHLLRTWDTPFNPFMDQVPGIAFLNALDEVTLTEERAQIKDFDALPFPDRGAIDLSRYYRAWKGKHGHSALNLNTMRGCPYTCKWCSRAVYGLSYRRRSPALVVDELEQITQQWPVDTIWFTDDVFTVSHKWLRAFAEELETRGLQIKYECITRADRMNEEVIDLLKASGCFRVWIGAESGSQRILDAMDRRVQASQVRDMIRATREAGLEAGTFIMLGYPGETRQDIEATIDHLVESAPDQWTLTVAYPIKGTELYQEVEADILHQPEWESGSDREIDFKRNYARAYYDHAVRRVNHSVRAAEARRKGRWWAAWQHRIKAWWAGRQMSKMEGGKG